MNILKTICLIIILIYFINTFSEVIYHFKNLRIIKKHNKKTIEIMKILDEKIKEEKKHA